MRILPPKNALAISSFLSAMILTLGLAAGITARSAATLLMTEGLPDDVIVISSGRRSVGPLSFSTLQIDDAVIDSLKSDPRVLRLTAEEVLAAPSRVVGSLFGRAYGTDVAVVGVGKEQLAWFAPDLDPSRFVDTVPLPVIVPAIALDAYNYSFAPANSLPLLDRSAFSLKNFTLEVGSSSLRTMDNAVAIPASIVDFSTSGRFLGVAAPLAFVQRMNRELGFSNSSRRVFIVPRSAAEGTGLADEMKSRGFNVGLSEERLAGSARLDLLLLIFFGGGALSLTAIASITSFFAASTYLKERGAETELLRHLCLSNSEILSHYLKRLAGPGVIGSFFGGASALAVHAAIIPIIASYFSVLDIGSPGIRLLIFALAVGFGTPALGSVIGTFRGARMELPESGRTARDNA